jgi:hypothetical protein
MELDSNNRVQRCATGSGPATWNHNWLPDGIADLNGNVWEWCAGMRLVDGEIQVIPYANCMDPEVSLGASSTAWKAIDAEGDLVEPGTSGTLKYDYLTSKITLTTDAVTDDGSTGRSTSYASMGLKSGLVVPELAKALILYPDEPGGDYGGDNRYITLAGERLPFCGGNWSSASSAGVFFVNLGYTRSNSDTYFGFRSAFCEL